MTTVREPDLILRQYELCDAGGSILVCWLEEDKRLKVGVRLTLKGTGNRQWMVSQRYKTTRTGEDMAFNRRWKVGGLL